jgi:hypothetical protein
MTSGSNIRRDSTPSGPNTRALRVPAETKERECCSLLTIGFKLEKDKDGEV